MKPKDLYEFKSYRDFLKFRFPAIGDGRGQRAKLAKHIGCQTSFISLVLSSKAHVNEDMAFAICDYLKLSDEDTRFFLILFHMEKAGSQRLRVYYQEQIRQTLKKRSAVQSRVVSDQQVEFEKQMRLFSEWFYMAIFAIVQIPEFRESRAIADKLHLSENVVEKAVTWMIGNGFLKREKNLILPSSQRLHIGSDSMFIDQHHRNWRQEAVRSLNRKSDADLHYSGALSLSIQGYFKVRELVLQTITSIEEVLKPSKDEEFVGICFDVFRY